MRKKLGFTFIEILVVITIISIVTTLGVTTYGSFLKQSRDAKRKGDLEQIRAAVEMYKSKNDLYPISAIGGPPPTSVCDPVNCATNMYLSKTPQDPKPNEFQYYYLSDGSSYTLGALLELPQTGTPCGDCDATGTAACNYCLGPYGQL